MKIMEVVRGALVPFIALISAGCVSQGRHYLEPADRTPVAGREAVVIVPQGEISALFVPSTAGGAFGIVGALVDVSVNQHRASSAEKSVMPVRTALVDFHFDQEALTASQETLTKLDWLGVHGTVSFTKDNSKQNLDALFDKSQAPQIVLVAYNYSLSPNAGMIEVDARVSISPKVLPKEHSSDNRASLANALFTRNMQYLVPLGAAATDIDTNCLRWSENNGARARLALQRGISGVNELTLRALAETAADVKTQDSGKKVEAGGRSGKLIDEGNQGTLLVDPLGSWVLVAKAPIE